MTQNISVIIINTPLTDGLGLDFAIECANKKFFAVMLFSKDELFGQIKERTSPYEIFVLSEKTDKNTLSQALIVLISTAKKLSRLETQSGEKLTKALELKLISRAKMILISSFGMNEEQAHKYIERRAMEARKTRKSIAESIINLYGN